MGQTHSAPPEEAEQFRQMALATYRGDLNALIRVFRQELRGLQISRATYLDICVQEQTQLETLTDSLEREQRRDALQDEKMEFFAAVEQGRLVLGDTLLHVAVRLAHTEVLDFLLLTDHAGSRKASVATPSTSGSSISSGATSRNSNNQAAPSAPLPTQTPNFKGELPRDVTGNNCALQLLLATIADVQDVFGISYRDEPKVHRMVRSLRRLWPLWMFEGQQEAAALVRVLYDVRSSDAAFGGLVRVAIAVGERFRVAVSRDGVRLALGLLAQNDGDLHQARQTLTKDWTADRKCQELTRIFRRWFPLWKAGGRRKDRDEEEARVEFFDAAMTAWLQIAQDVQLFGQSGTATDDQTGNGTQIELPDAAALKRYDLQVWQRRIAPPAASVGELCVHINALEGYLKMPHLSA